MLISPSAGGTRIIVDGHLWNDIDRDNKNYSEEKLFYCHFGSPKIPQALP